MKRENNNKKINKNKNYSNDLNEKLLIMRHGKTFFNADKDNYSRLVNQNFADSRLTPKGIEQAKRQQKLLNSLSIETVYVSPFYRALQTLTISLENHPDKNNITVVVHPLIGERTNCINDYILDIKQTKKDFNINSSIKIDWTFFDEYIKGIKYDENFYYFDNLDCLGEREKNKIYLTLKNYYDKGDIDGLKNGLSNLAKLISLKNIRIESLKHLQERFIRFCEYIRERHKDTLNDKIKKIFVVSHGAFMNVGTDLTPYKSEKEQVNHPGCYRPNNGEILSFKL